VSLTVSLTATSLALTQAMSRPRAERTGSNRIARCRNSGTEESAELDQSLRSGADEEFPELGQRLRSGADEESP